MLTILKCLILNPIRRVIAVVTAVWRWFGVGSVRPAVRVLLIAVGTVVFLCVAFLAWVRGSIGHRGREVEQIAAAIKPGMTIDQVVAVFPTGFWYASVSVPRRTDICKDAEGHVFPPDEGPALFPDMAEGDTEGEELSWNARQMPLRLDRMELLDQHLRTRKEWDKVVRGWTVYVQDKKDDAESDSFLRRGTAYLQHDDFDRGYKDLKAARKLGSKEGCTALAALPKKQVTAFKARLQRAIADAPACEAPVSSFSLQPSENANEFEVQVYLPGPTERPPSKRVSRAEFGELLKREFSGREWGARFTYQTDFPLRLSFDFVVGRDGKVKCVSPVRGWD